MVKTGHKVFGEEIDPVVYEILKHRLFSYLQEGRHAMAKVSGSPIATEAKETMCAVYNAKGDGVLSAAGVFLHITGIEAEIKYIIENYSDSPGIFDGDIFFFNDPYIGGVHSYDIASIMPIFHKEELIGWVNSLVHSPETGAIEPGGMPAKATEIYHEGFCLPGLKVMEKWEIRNEVFAYLERATRSPAMIVLDTKARNAACLATRKGIIELIERYGLDTIKALFRALQKESSLLARAKLRKLPDGTWTHQTFIEHDGQGYKLQRIKCTMTKEDDHLTFDYTGSSLQGAGSANCAYPGTLGSLFVALASSVFWDVPWNSGMIEPVTLVAPEGTLVNCKYPAACSQCPPMPGIEITVAASVCIGKMLACSEEFKEDLNAGWATTIGFIVFGGIDQYGVRRGSAFMDCFQAGAGAGMDRDGVDTAGAQMTPESCGGDVEGWEIASPVVYLFRNHRVDSAGPGKFRGGSGFEVAYMAHRSPQLYLGFRSTGDKVNSALGIWGGYPGGGSKGILASDGKEVIRQLREQNIPANLEELLQVKGAKAIPAYYSTSAEEGMTIGFVCSGGGGYGDPLEREPEKVKEDVMSFIHSFEVAKNVYGVILDRENFEINWEETKRQRENILKERLRRGKKEL